MSKWTPEERQRLIEKMFTAFVRDEDGGNYSGIVSAFNAVFPEIIELCAQESEYHGVNDIADEIRKFKDDPG